MRETLGAAVKYQEDLEQAATAIAEAAS